MFCAGERLGKRKEKMGRFFCFWVSFSIFLSFPLPPRRWNKFIFSSCNSSDVIDWPMPLNISCYLLRVTGRKARGPQAAGGNKLQVADILFFFPFSRLGFPCSSVGKESACSAGDPGWEDPLEKEMATNSSILAWKISWTEEPGGLQSMGSQRVGHDWVTNTHTHTPTHTQN